METMLVFFVQLCLAQCLVNAANLSHATKECGVRFEDNGVCVCSTEGPHRPVLCGQDNHSIEIQPCYTASYDQHLNMTVVGHSLFSCYNFPPGSVKVTFSSQFNDAICSQYPELHRKGRFCGQCNDSYGLAVYSYSYLSCVPCQDYGYKNWLKYFAVALLPLTLFYILAVLMSFNITSSNFNGIVMVIQCITVTEMMQLVLQKKPIYDEIFNKVLISIVGVANLDFFRWLYTPFCLHPEATIFEVLSLDYIVALYPFLLIFMTYALVTAYDRQYRLLVCMWKPFKILTRQYRETWNIRTSLIEIFATFIVLSSVKILGVSFEILAFTPTYDVTGKKLNYYLTLHDANIEYFGPQHLPFAVLALTVSLVFVLLPLLLLVTYPCGCFHRCLNRCGLTCQTLHVFMDAFQGSYRTHPRDMRYFSALYPLLRVLLQVDVQVPPRLYAFGILLLMSACLVSLVRPYKVSSHNVQDTILLILLGIYFISCDQTLTSANHTKSKSTGELYQSLAVLVLTGYFVVLLLWKSLRRPVLATCKRIGAKRAAAAAAAAGGNDNAREIEWFIRDQGEVYPPLLRR